MWANRAFVLLSTALTALPCAAGAEAPLSAIDWLSQSVATPATLPRPEPPVATVAAPSTITVAPLGGPSPDALGLVPAARAGLPRDLWGASKSADLARLLRAEQPDTLPAIRALLMSVLLAELDPPVDSDPAGALFLARIDKLLDLGALEPALSLLELIDRPRPEPFRRWFDASLLLGEEDRACRVMRDTPEIAPTFPARIFCLARGGDWAAAALSMRTGQTLGTIEPQMADLLARFLDPELFEGEGDLPVPERPSPLVLRLMEAIGQPLQTQTLPVAFAQADLRSNSGWKARIEAGERLARMGAIPPNRLLGLYSEQKAAASGGVWERVKAVQAFEAALNARDPEAAAGALPPVWAEMEAQELEVPFANLFGARLAALGLGGEAGALAFRIGLLSDGYERVAAARQTADPGEAFLVGIARGETAGTVPPDQLGVAIEAAFADTAPISDTLDRMLKEERLGEALLMSMQMVTEGAKGDLRDVTEGLTFLRHAGFGTAARRAALELLLLERRG
jgi:hypothetical protein